MKDSNAVPADLSTATRPTPIDDQAQSSFLRDVGGTFTSRALMLAGAFLMGIISYRLLGPAGRGAYVVVAAFLEITAIFAGLGLGQANVYFVGRRAKPKQVFANSIFIATVMGIATLSAIFVFKAPLSAIMSGLDQRFLMAVGLIMPAQLLLIFAQHIFLGKERIRDYNLLRNMEVLVQLGLMVLLVVGFGLGVVGAVSSLLISTVAALAIALYKLRFDLSIKLDLKQLHASLIFGFKTYLTEISQFLNFRLDMFLVAFFLDFRNVGYYSVAVSLAQVLWNLPFALGTVLFSRSASSKTGSMDALTPKACRVILTVVAGFVILLFIFAGPVITLLFGKASPQSLVSLRLLLPGMLAFSIHQVLYMDLAGRGRPEVGTIASLVALIVTIGLDLTLIPIYGISGAAIATSCSYGIGALYVLRSFKAVTGIPIKKILVPEAQDFTWLWQKSRAVICQGLTAGSRNV